MTEITALKSSLTEKIYEAASFPVRWVEVLEDIATLAGAAGTLMFAVDLLRPTEEVRYVVTPSIAVQTEAYMASEWRYKNTRPMLAIGQDRPVFYTAEELIGGVGYENDEFRRSFLNPHGLDAELGTVIVAPDGKTLVIAVLAALGKTTFDSETVDLFTELRPHVARSVQFAARAGLQQSEITAQTLNLLGVPAAILTSGGVVITANSIFPFDGNYFTTGLNDRLTPIAPESRRLLQTAIDDGLTGNTSPKSFPIFGNGESTPYVAHLLPMPGDARDLFNRACFILVLTQLAEATPPPMSVLRALFDLTPAESNVARALTAGASIEQIAEQLSRSRETVRGQVKTILEKTGTNRQGQLISLLLGQKIRFSE